MIFVSEEKPDYENEEQNVAELGKTDSVEDDSTEVETNVKNAIEEPLGE